MLYLIIGIHLLGKVKNFNWMNNFQSVSNSFSMILQLIFNQNFFKYVLEYTIDKADCDNSLSRNIYEANMCGTNLAYIYFFSLEFIFSFLIINLFLSVIHEVYFFVLKQNEACINQDHIKIFLKSWSQYDPTGKGYIYYQDFIKLLESLAPPLGVKVVGDFTDKSTRKNKVSPGKRIFNLLYLYDLLLFNQNKVHFREVFTEISKKAVMQKYNVNELWYLKK